MHCNKFINEPVGSPCSEFSDSYPYSVVYVHIYKLSLIIINLLAKIYEDNYFLSLCIQSLKVQKIFFRENQCLMLCFRYLMVRDLVAIKNWYVSTQTFLTRTKDKSAKQPRTKSSNHQGSLPLPENGACTSLMDKHNSSRSGYLVSSE